VASFDERWLTSRLDVRTLAVHDLASALASAGSGQRQRSLSTWTLSRGCVAQEANRYAWPVPDGEQNVAALCTAPLSLRTDQLQVTRTHPSICLHIRTALMTLSTPSETRERIVAMTYQRACQGVLSWPSQVQRSARDCEGSGTGQHHSQAASHDVLCLLSMHDSEPTWRDMSRHSCALLHACAQQLRTELSAELAGWIQSGSVLASAVQPACTGQAISDCCA